MTALTVEALPVYCLTECNICDAMLAIVGTINDCYRATGDNRARPTPPPDAVANVVSKLHARGHQHAGPNEITSLAIFVFSALQYSDVPDVFRV